MSIVRRIKREARNNPAKAAVLVALLGLAVYFWAPLLAGWLSNGRESKTTSNSERSQDNDPATFEQIASQPQDNTQEDKKSEPSWVELRQWHDESPWTSPVELAGLRDPFASPRGAEEIARAPEENSETLQASPEHAIAEMDIQLTGTIVGPRRRVALLDGRAYHEGDMLQVEELGTTWELEVREIGNNRVKLAWQSIERVVTAPERPKVGRIELVNRTK